MTSNQAVLPKVPKSGASTSKKLSRASVISADVLCVLSNLVGSINMWQSPLPAGSPVGKRPCPCARASCLPWPRRHTPGAARSCPAVPGGGGGGGVGRAGLNALTGVSLCCWWDLLFLPKAEDRGRRAAPRSARGVSG